MCSGVSSGIQVSWPSFLALLMEPHPNIARLSHGLSTTSLLFLVDGVINVTWKKWRHNYCNILTSDFTKPFHLLLSWLETTSSHFNFLDSVTFPFCSDRFFQAKRCGCSAKWNKFRAVVRSISHRGPFSTPYTNMWHVDEIRLDEPVGMVNRIFIISTGAPTQIFTVPKGNCSYNLQPILFRCSVGVLL